MDDVQAIRAIALDDIEGWYTADAGRMNHVLSNHLAKRRIVSASEIWDVDKSWMVDAPAVGKGQLEAPESGRRSVILLDQTETMASVKIASEVFVDYFHLSKSDNTWRIVNVLWDYRKKPSA